MQPVPCPSQDHDSSNVIVADIGCWTAYCTHCDREHVGNTKEDAITAWNNAVQEVQAG